MLKFVTFFLLLVGQYSLCVESENHSFLRNVPLEKIPITTNYNLTSSFVPEEPFTLDYGMYCLKDSGASINQYFQNMHIHYSRRDNAYIIEAPYLTYVKEEDRFFRDKYENTSTHEITYGDTVYDLWSLQYNPQPYITRTDCFEPDVYYGSTYVMRLGFTVSGIQRAENSYYYQNLKISTYELAEHDYNNVHFNFRQWMYCSGIKTTTSQQTIGGITYNVTSLGNLTISKSGTWASVAVNYHPDTYGDHFLSTINCSGSGDASDKALVEANWQSVKDYYEALPSANQERIRLGSNPYDIDNLEMLERYDYCLFFKGYDLEDFLDRGELTNRYYQNNDSILSIYSNGLSPGPRVTIFLNPFSGAIKDSDSFIDPLYLVP